VYYIALCITQNTEYGRLANRAETEKRRMKTGEIKGFYFTDLHMWSRDGSASIVTRLRKHREICLHFTV